MSNFSLGSFDLAREIQMEKFMAQDAERRLFGNSVLAEIETDNFQPQVNSTKKNNNSKQTDVIKDKLEVSKSNDKHNNLDDGKISFKEKVKNFGKGLIAPIKNMFSSPKNIAITAVSALGCAALIGLTGGAAAPVLVAVGLIGGGVQIVKGIQKQAKAKTDAQAAQAWQDMGSGTFTVGVSALGAKTSLKANGANVSGMSTLKAAGKCIADVPKNISTGFSTAKVNISNFASSLKTPPVVPNSAPSSSASSPALPPAPSAPALPPASSAPVTPTSTPIPSSNPPIATSAPSVPSVEAVKPLLLEAPKQPLLLEAPKTPIYDSSAQVGAKLYPQLIYGRKLPIYKPYEVIDVPSLNGSQNKPILLLEAPKGDVIPDGVVKPASAKTGAKPKKVHKTKTKNSSNVEKGKISFWEKFKDFFRVFGFFKEKPTVDSL